MWYRWRSKSGPRAVNFWPWSLSDFQSSWRYYLMSSKCEHLLRAIQRPLEERKATEAVSSVILCFTHLLTAAVLCPEFSPRSPPLLLPFPSIPPSPISLFRRTVSIWTSLFDYCEKQALSAHKLDIVWQFEAPNPIAMRANLPSIWFAEIN